MTYALIHTIRFCILALLITCSFFWITSTTADAYFTTSQAETQLDSHSALFTIDYVFGVKKHTVHMPVRAENTQTQREDTVSYEVVDESGVRVPGKTKGIVFSSAPLARTGMYVVPKNTAKKFTLAVVFTPEKYVEGKKYRLQVTYLPFSFDGVQQLRLNPSELVYYTTKYLSVD